MTQPQSCLGAPAGYRSPCGEYPSPHGPHGPVAAADVAAEEREQVRARQIAAIHALATFYAEHPEEPMPKHILANHTSWSHEAPEHDRVIQVLEFAQRHGEQADETWEDVKARHTLTEQDGMRVTLMYVAHLDQRPAHRYVP